MKKIVLASHNAGKLKEFQLAFKSLEMEVIPQSAYHVAEIEETGRSFVENAILKARNACAQTNLPALADDSGLVVDALGGNPGIYSARFAGAHASAQDNIKKLLSELKDIPKRNARFVCVLVMMQHQHDPLPIIAEGQWDGEILTELTGSGGFGYDPVFYVVGEKCSAAELNKQEKNKISHRGKAIRKMMWKMANP